eukprot:7616338-Karenia_brevis.AAC.1
MKLQLMQPDNPQGNAAVSQSHHAGMIKKQYQKLSQLHQQGAAAEYQIQKVWEYLQYLALRHKQHACTAQEHSTNINKITEEFASEIDAMSTIPDSKEAVEQHRSLHYHWLKPNMGRIRHAQELADR